MKPVLKYRNVKTTVDGKTFDSKKEAKRHQDLNLLKRAGQVIEFINQPEFVLYVGERDKWTGEKIRDIKYRADFAVKYKDLDHWVVEDVKGGKATQTPDFIIKKKLFIQKFPCIEMRII